LTSLFDSSKINPEQINPVWNSTGVLILPEPFRIIVPDVDGTAGQRGIISKEVNKPKEVEMIHPKKKELLNATVYRAVKQMIAVHRLEPGLRLNVEKIARELGVSRTPVWEAIRRLEQEGLLKNIPNRGVFLMEVPLERTLEVMETRITLDKLAGRLACDRIGDRVLDQLTQFLRDQLRAVETADLALYSSADLRFHGLIYEVSGNGYLKELFESITLHMLPARLQVLPLLPLLCQGHQEIIEALANRDPDRVETALARHLGVVVAHIKDQLRSATERKEMVQRIREKFSPLKAPPKGTGIRKQKLDLLSNPG